MRRVRSRPGCHVELCPDLRAESTGLAALRRWKENRVDPGVDDGGDSAAGDVEYHGDVPVYGERRGEVLTWWSYNDGLPLESTIAAGLVAAAARGDRPGSAVHRRPARGRLPRRKHVSSVRVERGAARLLGEPADRVTWGARPAEWRHEADDFDRFVRSLRVTPARPSRP